MVAKNIQTTIMMIMIHNNDNDNDGDVENAFFKANLV